MKKLIIRSAKKNELKVIQELNHRLFLHDEKYDPQLNMDWSFGKNGENYFEERISGKGGVCFIAEVDGKVVGYLAGGMLRPHSYRKVKQSELENTLVEEGFRDQGIGEKLFREFVRWSKQQGVGRIKVSTYTENLKAIKFYRKVGFKPHATELEYEVK